MNDRARDRERGRERREREMRARDILSHMMCRLQLLGSPSTHHHT